MSLLQSSFYISRPVLKNLFTKSFRHTNHLRLSRGRFNSTSTSNEPNQSNLISVTFNKPDGSKMTVRVQEGKTLYDAVIDNNLDIDGFGACEGTLCCTTCHLIFKQPDYEKVGPPNDEELDMLDLAYGLTDTSRLGCQVHLKKEYDPLEVEVTAGVNDAREA